MANRRPLHTLCALFGLAMACQPGRAETAQGFDDVVLTAADPVAAFEVTLCMTGGSPNGLNLYSSLNATVSASEGASEGAVEFTLESLDPDPEGTATAYVDVIETTSEAQPTSISLNTGRDWEDSDSRRCQEQVVQLSVPSLAEGQTVTISDFNITLVAEWAGICGETPDEGALSIEAVRI